MYLALGNLIKKKCPTFVLVCYYSYNSFCSETSGFLCDRKVDQNNFTEYWSLTSYQLQQDIMLLYCMLLSNVM